MFTGLGQTACLRDITDDLGLTKDQQEEQRDKDLKFLILALFVIPPRNNCNGNSCSGTAP